ncbi:MAG: tRNA lysidine(34) synthetase TilS [Gammaproteobacteria bacterium]|nr:tRNA lysidine(34) synthetase TilS [Gammaproteobacteria bacterium]
MKFSLDNLAAELNPVREYKTLILGLSGGLDSMVLLYAVNELIKSKKICSKLTALHINHRLQVDSDDWERFCKIRCAELGIPIIVKRLETDSLKENKSDLENKARKARYEIFESIVDSDSCLILAHHFDDQLETLIFRLNRGAGIKGLTAMPQSRVIGSGILYRPLLKIEAKSLYDFAEATELQWVVDHSNANVAFDRNYLRHEILPRIERRWPNYRESWAKSLELISEAREVTEEVVLADFSSVVSDASNKLILSLLMNLTKARQRNVIKYWLMKIAKIEIGWNKLQHMVNEVLPAASHSNLEININEYLICSYRNQLYLLRKYAPLPNVCHWDLKGSQKLVINNNGVLMANQTEGKGISGKLVDNLQVRFRQGGENFRISGRPLKSLKKILQESKVEPWIRPRIPLIYNQDELVCVVGIGISASASAAPEEIGFSLSWDFPNN